jgi:hypothetical protein
MARAIQQIKQDLAGLEEQSAIYAAELHSRYLKYLNVLSQSVRKQVILASYQICTQSYPELFLALSFNQRQKLQENLQKLGKELLSHLLSYLEPSDSLASLDNANVMEQMLESFPLSAENSPELTESPPETGEPIANPDRLVQWCKKVEKGIAETLEHLSQEANRYLQQAQILPTKLPAKVIEMAIQAEETGSTLSGAPNLLNLLIETSDNNDDESSQALSNRSDITKITAIRLRLSEIEFADADLSVERQQIRNLLEKVNKIQRLYHKKQRECAVAEAETAWRSSWFED